MRCCLSSRRAKQELEEIESSLHSDSSGQLKFLESGHKSEAPELEDVEEEAEIGEEGLIKLQTEVNSLQEQFDGAVIEKHSLGVTCQQLAEKLKSVNHLLERYVHVKGDQTFCEHSD